MSGNDSIILIFVPLQRQNTAPDIWKAAVLVKGIYLFIYILVYSITVVPISPFAFLRPALYPSLTVPPHTVCGSLIRVL